MEGGQCGHVHRWSSSVWYTILFYITHSTYDTVYIQCTYGNVSVLRAAGWISWRWRPPLNIDHQAISRTEPASASCVEESNVKWGTRDKDGPLTIWWDYSVHISFISHYSFTVVIQSHSGWNPVFIIIDQAPLPLSLLCVTMGMCPCEWDSYVYIYIIPRVLTTCTTLNK